MLRQFIEYNGVGSQQHADARTTFTVAAYNIACTRTLATRSPRRVRVYTHRNSQNASAPMRRCAVLFVMRFAFGRPIVLRMVGVVVIDTSAQRVVVVVCAAVYAPTYM